MPIYEYKCGECGGVTEHLASGSSEKSPACVHCGSDNISKMFSVPSAPRAGQGSEPCGGMDGACSLQRGVAPPCGMAPGNCCHSG